MIDIASMFSAILYNVCKYCTVYQYIKTGKVTKPFILKNTRGTRLIQATIAARWVKTKFDGTVPSNSHYPILFCKNHLVGLK